jgi:signal transduction histidine kinase
MGHGQPGAGPSPRLYGRTRSSVERYGVAVVAVAAAVLLQRLPARWGSARPFLLLNGAVLLSAWYAGRGPAIASVLLATISVAFAFIPHPSSLAAGALDLGLFLGEASLTAALAIAITESRARAEAWAAHSRRSEQSLHKVNKAYCALSTCNEALVRAHDEKVLLEEICRTVVEVAGYRMCWVGYAERDEAKSVRPVARAGYDEGYVDGAEVSWADTERGRGPVGTAIRTGRPFIMRDFAADAAFAPWRTEAQQHGYGSLIAVPLHTCDRAFGALAIYAAESNAFDGDAVRLLTDLGNDLAYGITALHARAAIAAERARFETAIMQAPVAVAVYAGPDHIVRLANRRWLALGLGIEAVGRPLRDSVPDAARAGAFAVLDEAYATGESRELHERPLSKVCADGSVMTRYFNVAYQPVTCAAGQVREVVVAISDVTDQVLARRILEESRETAEQASRAKDEFLRMVSHELRTPLTPIIGLADGLKKEACRDAHKLQRGLEIILGNAKMEARLVDDLIEITQFVAGAVHLEMHPVDLGALVRASVDEVARDAAAKGVAVDATVGPGVTVWGDERRLSEAMHHVLSNALKFTPRGGRVTVEVTRQSAAVVLRVHDTGEGIPPGDLSHVFELFRTGDGSIKRAHRGLGLGLYLVHQIVKAHGGKVWAESEGPGKGATLVAQLDAPEVEHAERAAATTAPPARVTDGATTANRPPG